jgi:hypothetical protein
MAYVESGYVLILDISLTSDAVPFTLLLIATAS